MEANKKIQFTSLVLLGLLPYLAGCVTKQYTPEGAKIRVTSNPEIVRNCKYISNVRGSDHMNGGIGQGAAAENSMREIQNKTAELGGNTLHLVTNNIGWGGAEIRGEAYFCKNK